MDSVVLDVERLGVSQASGSQRVPLSERNQPSISLEPLSPPHPEAMARTPADITIAVTSKKASPRITTQHLGDTQQLNTVGHFGQSKHDVSQLYIITKTTDIITEQPDVVTLVPLFTVKCSSTSLS